MHADYAMAKAQKISSAIIKNIIIPNRSIGWKLFQTYVQPVLLYASVAWNNKNNQMSNMLEKVQRKYTKKLNGLAKHEYKDRLRALRVCSLAAMRTYYDLIFAFKIIHKRMPFDPSDFGMQLSNRSRAPLFIQEKIHCERARNFARYRIPEEWNALPLNIRLTVTIVKFKKLLYNWLLAYD